MIRFKSMSELPPMFCLAHLCCLVLSDARLVLVVPGMLCVFGCLRLVSIE